MGCPTAVTTSSTTGSGPQVALAQTVGSAAGATLGGMVAGVCIAVVIVVLVLALRKMKKRSITTPAIRFDNNKVYSDQGSVGLEIDSSSISSSPNPSYVTNTSSELYIAADTYAAVRTFPNAASYPYESHVTSDTAQLAKSDTLSTGEDVKL